MYNIELNPSRNHISFHNSKVAEALPDFYDSEYPLFVKFLETYYDYMDGDANGSFSRLIRDLFHSRDISSLKSSIDNSGNPIHNEFLDSVLEEIGDGLESSSFYNNPRMMTRLIADFYRSKGTQISAEQFFKAFYNEDVEVTYPKKNIFILNDKLGGSLVGPDSLHYIQDDKRYQIFSVLLKTGIPFNDYEELYRKMVHPAGFHLAADVVVQGLAEINVRAGLTTDPLAVAEAPLQLVALASPLAAPLFTLLTMKSTVPVDSTFAVSSAKTLEQYQYMPLSRLNDIHGTVANWVSPASVTMDNDNVLMSDTSYREDADEE